jgi:hypothetical protein
MPEHVPGVPSRGAHILERFKEVLTTGSVHHIGYPAADQARVAASQSHPGSPGRRDDHQVRTGEFRQENRRIT